MIKWFQHQSNSFSDLNVQPFVEEFGMEGYGFWWRTCELVAEKGSNYRIKAAKNWKEYLKSVSKFPTEKCERMWDKMAYLDLIDKKAYSKGDLYQPKMKKYSDNYTKYLKRDLKDTSKSIK